MLHVFNLFNNAKMCRRKIEECPKLPHCRTTSLPNCFFLQGVGPTANRAAIVVGVELPAYDFCKQQLILSGYFTDNAKTHLL